ncbi:MAG: TonB-dependent receptor, partial [Verrucomicrobiaceae bacterium]|nr:TonB-dependent receptor [Verrucomicrobiaceae bacterium]
QGTLFGRNTLGGAVLYTPAAPTYKFGGELSVAVGNYNDREFKGAINVPIIDDKLAVRLAGYIQRRNGWAKDIGTGADLENIDTKSGRLSVLFDPIQGVSNTLVLDYYKSRDHGFESLLTGVNTNAFLPTVFGLGPAFAAQFAAQQGRDQYTVNYNLPQFTHNERFGATDKLEVNLAPGYDLINIFGYRSTQLSYNTNVDGMSTIQSTLAPGLPVKFLVGDLYDNTHQYSDEIQLRGLSFDDKLDWLAGLFYLKSEPSGTGGNLVAFASPLTPASSTYNFITQTSKAVFLNGKYDLGSFVEGVKFNAGIRYTKDETESCTGSAGASGLYDLSDCKNGVGLTGTGSVTAKSNATTWNIGFDWQIDPDLFSYITARHGYRAGGVNGPTLQGRLAEFQSFDPDTVTDVEIGIRSDAHFGDALLRSNVSVFSGWYDKVQLPVTGISVAPNQGVNCTPANQDQNPSGDCSGSLPAGGTLLINAGKTRVSGIDYAFTFAPDEHWTFDVGGTFMRLDTIKADFPDWMVQGGYIESSKKLPFNYAAKKSVSSSVRYEFPLRGNMGDVALNLNYYWTGETAISTATVPSYGIFNGRIDWNNVAESSVDLSLFAKNLGDKVYISGGVASGTTLGETTSLVGAPRTYGVEARYRF